MHKAYPHVRKEVGTLERWTTCINKIEVIKVLSMRSNCYLVRKDDDAVLIDTSVRREAKWILSRLKSSHVDKLHAILLTHAHYDHLGNAHLFQETFKSHVFVHSSEKQFLAEGYTYLPKGTMPHSKLMMAVAGKKRKVRHSACLCDSIMTELSYVPPESLNLQILHTPGHTLGSVSFVVDDNVALVGDTMVNPFGINIMPPFANFPEQLPESWEKLLKTNCQYFLPSHGNEIDRSLLERCYRKIVKKGAIS